MQRETYGLWCSIKLEKFKVLAGNQTNKVINYTQLLNEKWTEYDCSAKTTVESTSTQERKRDECLDGRTLDLGLRRISTLIWSEIQQQTCCRKGLPSANCPLSLYQAWSRVWELKIDKKSTRSNSYCIPTQSLNQPTSCSLHLNWALSVRPFRSRKG